MKKFYIILNILLLLVCLFFVVHARINTDVAKENTMQAMNAQMEADANTNLALEAAAQAEQEAANLKMAQLETKKIRDELNQCKQSK